MSETSHHIHGRARRTAHSALGVVVRHQFAVALASVVVAASFVFFYGLNTPTIRMWDESRLAVNALEMISRGDYVVTYYDGEPDLWNTKPPLMIWLIAGSMKIFGFNEIALRLPSALSGMAITVLLFLFCTYYLRDLKAAVASSFVLMTSTGFVGEHVARTGDYDALLVLWICTYTLCYFIYLHADDTPRKSFYLLATAVALSLAVLTKGVAGLMCLPGLLGYTIWEGKLKELMLSPMFYVAGVVFLLPTAGYYLLREFSNPGYLQAVAANELTGRYGNSLENHAGGFLFYFRDLLDSKFVPWIYLLLPSFLVTLFSGTRAVKRVGLYACMYVGFYFAIVSFAQTKLPWYDAPLYPMAALLIGVAVSEVLDVALLKISGRYRRSLAALLLLCGVFSIPYLDVAYAEIYKRHGMLYSWSRGSHPKLSYGTYLRQISDTSLADRALYVVSDDYNAHLAFYAGVANRKGGAVEIVSTEREFAAGKTLVTCIPEVVERLKKRYALRLVHSAKSCRTFVVSGRE